MSRHVQRAFRSHWYVYLCAIEANQVLTVQVRRAKFLLRLLPVLTAGPWDHVLVHSFPFGVLISLWLREERLSLPGLDENIVAAEAG